MSEHIEERDSAVSRLRAGSTPPLAGLLLLSLLLVYVAVVVRTAWVSDDAYITMRTVDNFLHGHGLRWNPAERVQSYTHPLWMFALAVVYVVLDDAYFSMLTLSFFFSIAAVAIVGFGVARSVAGGAMAISILLLSKGFTDYSTSGLENPLTHALLALFLWLYCTRAHNLDTLFWLAVVAGLAVLNRMDTLLLFAPALAWLWWRLPKLQGTLGIVVAFLPFIAWELFSLLYYGFLFPNTAFAKLNTGIPDSELLLQGFLYWLYSFNYDPITPVLILVGLCIPLFTRNWRLAPLSLGAALYVLYVTKVGGDFMGSRFFSAPLLCAAALLAQLPISLRQPAVVLAFAGVWVLGFMAPHPTLLSNASYGESDADRKEAIAPSGVADERAYYYQRTGLLKLQRNEPWPFVTTSRLNPPVNPSGIVVENNTGFMGYYGAKQRLHILDDYALCDPLMARLPVGPQWRIGHFRRPIPAGYEQTVATGENQIRDPDLAEYYDKLKLIISGPLFDQERLRTVIEMNLGRYDHLLSKYKK
jgi:arabinofuranosyltransferase